VAEGDVLLVLSNSGETPELADILAHAKRFAIPLIAVAGREGSTLMRQADVGLLLPSVPEACDTGIVPTTSTTMTLALGDALAIALMEHRAFTPEHFRMFHPGGKLGARLLRVRDLMHDDPPLVPETLGMGETLLEITRRGFGVVGVTDARGDLAGIITDGDLRRHLDGLMEHRAGEVMTPNPRAIGPDALAGEALAVMNDRKITCLLVTANDSHKAIGILHVHDCLRAGVV
jgi:arabinose-5-phosphate isomerase